MPRLAELVVEQHARAGTALAVDVAHARQVLEPGEPVRVAGGDDQPLLAVHEPDDVDLAPRHHALDPRQRVLALSGSSRWQPREMAEAVAERDQPAERTDRAGDERLRRVARPQQRGGEVEHRVVRADRDDRALDGVEIAQQPDLDLRAGVVALELGGHDEQAVRAHERREHARAAPQRRRHEPAADAAEPDPDPVVGTERGGEPAREPRLRARTADGRGSLERGEQRDARRARR